MRFWTTQASTFQFCFGSVYFSKVKAKLKRACPTAQEKHRTPLTVSSMTTDLTGLKTCQVLSKIKNKKIDNSIEFLIFSTYIIHVDNPMGVTPLTIRLKPSLCVQYLRMNIFLHQFDIISSIICLESFRECQIQQISKTERLFFYK